MLDPEHIYFVPSSNSEQKALEEDALRVALLPFKMNVDNSPLKQLFSEVDVCRYHDCYEEMRHHGVITTLVLRKMAIARGISGYLQPAVIKLLVMRYENETMEIFNDYYALGFQAQRSDFNLARFICKTISEYDFKNYEWHVNGDKSAPWGNSLRFMHPSQPTVQVNPKATLASTKTIRRQMGRASRAGSVEEFISRKFGAVDRSRTTG
jgi:hypothetical protein